MEASEDLKTWTLTIRQAAAWRSGRPFTADDAIWNIRRVLDPKTGSSVLGLMKGYMLEEFETGEQKNGKPVKSTRLWNAKAIEKLDDRSGQHDLDAEPRCMCCSRDTRGPCADHQKLRGFLDWQLLAGDGFRIAKGQSARAAHDPAASRREAPEPRSAVA